MPSPDSPRAVDRSSDVPVWAQVEADLQRRLARGSFAQGVPGEHELAEQYAVSRHTVREALRRMRADGVVHSRRGRASRPGRQTIEQPLGALYSLFRSVEATGVEQRSEVRALELRTDARAAALLGCGAGAELVFIERLRLAGGEPLALDRSWLPRRVGDALLDGQFEHASLYGELARLTGIALTGGQESIRAIVPDAQTRRALKITAQVAVLAVQRIGCLDGQPVELRESLIRGDRFTITAQWPGAAEYRVGAAGLSTGE